MPGRTYRPAPSGWELRALSELTPIERYRRDARLRLEIQSAALGNAPRGLVTHWAKQLGLWDGKGPAAPNEFAATLLADLCVYAPWGNHPCGIERYAGVVRPDPASDEARILDALLAARISLFRIAEPDPRGGILLQELGKEAPVWLMDETLPQRIRPGAPFAARIAEADAFAMTTGIALPLDKEMLDAVKPADPTQPMPAAEFAARLYRAVLQRAG